jgi:prepilin-type processing-associated H-X9-DG protein
VADQNQVMADIKGRHSGVAFNIGYGDGHVKLTQTGAVAADGPNYWCLNPNPSWNKNAPNQAYYNCGVSNGFVVW